MRSIDKVSGDSGKELQKNNSKNNEDEIVVTYYKKH